MDIKLFEDNTKWIDNGGEDEKIHKLTIKIKLSALRQELVTHDNKDDWVSIAEISAYAVLSENMKEVVTFMN